MLAVIPFIDKNAVKIVKDIPKIHLISEFINLIIASNLISLEILFTIDKTIIVLIRGKTVSIVTLVVIVLKYICVTPKTALETPAPPDAITVTKIGDNIEIRVVKEFIVV